jgi:hypothetical protein
VLKKKNSGIIIKAVLIFLPSAPQLFSQPVSVDASKNTSELVGILLDGSCFETSIFTSFSNQSVGDFNNNNAKFPINEGVIIRNGNAMHTQGIYTGRI